MAELIVAFDNTTPDLLLNQIGDKVEWLKFDPTYFMRYHNPFNEMVEYKEKGKKIFLDFKLWGTPSYVKRLIYVAFDTDMISVYPDYDIYRAAERFKGDVIAVMTLSSKEFSRYNVDKFARDLISGYVCPPVAPAIKAVRNAGYTKIVVPGIRPEWYLDARDHKSTMTPYAAVVAGASHIVVGEPIYASTDPVKAVEMIQEEMRAAEHDLATGKVSLDTPTSI